MPDYEQHELITWFPSPEPEEYESLKKDIKEKGQLSPIVLHEGKVLEGWTRYRVCRELGLLPKTIVYEGDDPVGFCVSMNVKRRQLTPGKKAEIYDYLTKMYEQKVKEQRVAHLKQGDKIPVEISGISTEKPLQIPSAKQLQKELNVSPGTIHTYRKIKEKKPELLDKFIHGKVAASHARQQIQQEEQKETNGKVGQERKEFYQDHGRKFFYGRLGGDYAEKRGKPFTDEADDGIQAWLGCPEVGLMVTLKREGAEVTILIEETKGGKKFQETTQVIFEGVHKLQGFYNAVEKEKYIE